MICSLCRTRDARGAGVPPWTSSCPVCCGTKHLVQNVPATVSISSPQKGASGRRHIASTRAQSRVRRAVRAGLQRASVSTVFLVTTFLLRTTIRGSNRSIDARRRRGRRRGGRLENGIAGVVYEHRPASLPADRLATSLKEQLAIAGLVLRRQALRVRIAPACTKRSTCPCSVRTRPRMRRWRSPPWSR